MKKIFSILFFSLAVSATAWANDIYFEADFEKGMPKTITLLDRDENPTKSGLSRIDFSNGSWSTAQYDKGCSAAMSSAFCSYDYPVEDWMILPQVNVKSRTAVLAWDAMSIHYDFREDYKVMISTGSNKPADFTEVYTIQQEDYYIRRHAISLADYEGQNIYIAFVHTGQDKFMLGIDNIKVGEIYNEYALINHTDVSTTGGQDIEVCGVIRNLGSEDLFLPVLIVDDVIYDSYDADEIPTDMWNVAEEVPFSFSMPTPEEGKVVYSVGVKKSADGEVVWSVSDTLYCSAFPRNMLVEKFTGTWCNNCPQGTITLHKFKQRYRNRIITVEGHCAMGVEPMYDPTYHTGLAYWLHNLPSLLYDRRAGFVSQSAQDDGVIAKAWTKPVTAEIVPSVKYTAEGSFEVSSQVRFSQEYDNTNDQYRVGYIITENVVHQPDNSIYTQANSCQVPRCREFNFLPSPIPASLAFFHDVARGDVTAFDGVAMSLPQEMLTAYNDYQVIDTVAMPATPMFDTAYVYDPQNISITAVLIDTRVKNVMAACRVKTEDIDWSASVENTIQETPRYNITTTSGMVYVANIDGRATVRLYAVDGSLIDTAYGASVVVANAGQYRGVAIVAIETASGIVNEKILIK